MIMKLIIYIFVVFFFHIAPVYSFEGCSNFFIQNSVARNAVYKNYIFANRLFPRWDAGLEFVLVNKILQNPQHLVELTSDPEAMNSFVAKVKKSMDYMHQQKTVVDVKGKRPEVSLMRVQEVFEKSIWRSLKRSLFLLADYAGDQKAYEVMKTISYYRPLVMNSQDGKNAALYLAKKMKSLPVNSDFFKYNMLLNSAINDKEIKNISEQMMDVYIEQAKSNAKWHKNENHNEDELEVTLQRGKSIESLQKEFVVHLSKVLQRGLSIEYEKAENIVEIYVWTTYMVINEFE